MNNGFGNISKKDDLFKTSRLILQCDEIRSFFGSKKKKAMKHGLKLTEIQKKYAGSRDKEGALGLWISLPESCRRHIEQFSLIYRQRVSRLARRTL